MSESEISKIVGYFLTKLKEKSFKSEVYFQAIEEFLVDVTGYYESNLLYKKHNILERILIPDKVIKFSVTWINDKGERCINLGYRIQYNNTLGPYKGGLRFHPSVDQGILKFLGFEQIFKNALTGRGIGGAKGGSDFDPKGKSDDEIMSFCNAFMEKLFEHIGPRQDVPAGDIGVGGREIGYLYGKYKRLSHTHEGVLTGKDISFGGSETRTEATGYGLIYFSEEMLTSKCNSDDKGLRGKTCTVSGSGNVAIYAIEKLQYLGAIPVTCSDSKGTIYDSKGIKLDLLKKIKLEDRVSLEEYIKSESHTEYTPVSEYKENEHHVWSIPCDAAFPCATQNELTLSDAQNLISNGCKIVAEGANMPCSPSAIELLLKNNVLFAPAKAANAGGVAISSVEMEQNAAMKYMSFEEVDDKLKEIMKKIFNDLDEINTSNNLNNNFRKAANLLGFTRVADAMIKQGV